METVYQPPNPSNQERYALLMEILKQGNRQVDFPYIIRALNPPESITNILSAGSCKDKTVAVLGGGLAGLSAAYELKKLGCHITIYEAEERLGGRVYTYYFDKERNHYGELGAMRIPVAHQCTWHYLDLFNLETTPFVQENNQAFVYIRDIRVRNQMDEIMSKIYPEFPLTPREKEMTIGEMIEQGLFWPLYSMSPEVRQEALYSLWKYSPQIVYWSGLNNRKVLQEMNLSQGAINLISSISPIVGSFLYNSYSEVLQENYTGDFEYLYQIKGGFSNFTDAFYKALVGESNTYTMFNQHELGKVDFRMGTTVEGIRLAKNNKVVITSGMSQEEACHNHDEFYYDYVICALPYSRLRTIDQHPLLGDRQMEAIREVTYEDIQKTLFYCKKRFWLEQGIYGGGSVTDEAISTIYYPSDGIHDPNEPGVLLATYNLGLNASRIGNLSEARRVEVIKRQVEKVHGLPIGYLDDIVTDYKTINWGTEPWYLGICYYRAEQKTLFSASMDLPAFDGKMYYAGVHISETHGWMQGALKTAMEAANGIANHIKRSTSQ